MPTRQDLLNPNYYRSIESEFATKTKAARAGQTVGGADLTAAMDERERQWREENRAIQRGFSPDDVRRRLAPDLQRDLIRASRDRVTAASEAGAAARRTLEAVRAELWRIPEPSTAAGDVSATSAEKATHTMLSTLLAVSFRTEARQRADRLGSDVRTQFAALQRAESDGDLWLARELDERLEASIASGPQRVSDDVTADIAAFNMTKAALGVHRDRRIPPAERARLETAEQALDAIERDFRGASDLQSAMEHTGLMRVAE